MTKQILATAVVLTLAVVATTSAIASSHRGGHAGHHARHLHTVRGAESWPSADRAGFIDLGPLGFTAACGSYRTKRGYCGQGYSVSGWTY